MGCVILSAAVEMLRCPVCGAGLAEARAALRCPAGHSFDVARQGYVMLAPGRHSGDTAEMVAARERFLAGGWFDPLADAVAETCVEVAKETGAKGIVELGAGTGWYHARALDRLPGWVGLALDVSKPALRRAARAHARLAAVGCDVWGALPVRDGAAGVVLGVFAPRNAAEAARILAPGGALVLITPEPDHLEELVSELGLLSVEPGKEQRLAESLAGRFELVRERPLRFTLALDRSAAADLVAMGPSAFHSDAATRAAGLPEPITATVAVRLAVYACPAP